MSNTVINAVEKLKDLLVREGIIGGEVFETVEEIISELESPEKILIEWSVDDLYGVAGDMGLDITEQSAITALSEIKRNHDCEIGVNWDVVKNYVEQYADGKVETSIENCPHCDCAEFEIKLDKLYPCPECGKPLKACNICQIYDVLCNWKEGETECNFYNSDGTAKSV